MDAWEILYGNSSLSIGDAWEHLNAQEGGSSTFEVTVLTDGLSLQLDSTEFGVAVSDSAIDVELPPTELTVDAELPNIEVLLSDTSYDILVENSIVIVGEDEMAIKTTAVDVSGHRMVVTDSAGHIYYADKDAIFNGKRVIGMTLQAALAGTQCYIAISDNEVVEPTWNWDTSTVIYLGDDGMLTQVPPTEGFVLIVAVPLTPNSVRIRVEMPIFL